MLALKALENSLTFNSQAAAKRNVRRAIDVVAQTLRNTAAVCRKSYVHPALIDAYMDGSMARLRQLRPSRRLQQSLAHLRSDELTVLAILNDRLERETRAAS